MCSAQVSAPEADTWVSKAHRRLIVTGSKQLGESMTNVARKRNGASRTLRTCSVLGLAASMLVVAETATANARQIAVDLHVRLNAGVLPTAEKLTEMEALLRDGKPREAALAAINDSRGLFYTIVLRDKFAPLSVHDLSPFNPAQPINDMTATMIGMVRDDKPFNQVLSADILYFSPAVQQGTGAAPYSLANNNHYATVHTRDLALNNPANLAESPQSATGMGLPAAGVAGIMSTRGFAAAFYIDGTNRRAFKYVLKHFLGEDIERFKDTTIADFRVRKDVPRIPGGNATDFVNNCKGCHAGMDAMAGAFCYYNYRSTVANGPMTLVHMPGVIQEKCVRNSNEFEDGFQTVDDSWVNLWAADGGQNAFVGWPAQRDGRGAKSFGEMIGNTTAFTTTMARLALEVGCKVVDAKAEAYKPLVEQLAAEFKADKFNLKNSIASAAARCTPKVSI